MAEPTNLLTNQDQKEEVDLQDSLTETEYAILISSFEFLSIDEITSSENHPQKFVSQKTITPEEVIKKSSYHLCSEKIRKFNVYRLIQAAFPDIFTINPGSMLTLDDQINNTIACGEKTENDCYESAETKLEYYQAVQNQIDRIKKELEKTYNLSSENTKPVNMLKLKKQALVKVMSEYPSPVTKDWHKSLIQIERQRVILDMLEEIYEDLDCNDVELYEKLYCQIYNVYQLEQAVYQSVASITEYHNVVYVLMNSIIPERIELERQMLLEKQLLLAEKQHYEEKYQLLQLEKQRVEQKLKVLKQNFSSLEIE